MTAGNTVLTIAQYADDGSHHYINWPRERVCWWKLERAPARPFMTADALRAAFGADPAQGTQKDSP
jgi:hypothetical protein